MKKKFMTLAELSAYTGFSKAHIYRLTSTGKIKFSKPTGKLIFFSKEQVNEFLMQNAKGGNQ